MEVTTDASPEEISWEITNVDTNEIIASQEEGYYTEINTVYTHEEPICLDMDDSGTCYNVTVRDMTDTSDTNDTWFGTELIYIDEEYDDTYYRWTIRNDTYIVCDLSDFISTNGCLIGESPLWSCACGDSYGCVLEQAFAILFSIVFCPCISLQILFFVLLFSCYGV